LDDLIELSHHRQRQRVVRLGAAKGDPQRSPTDIYTNVLADVRHALDSFVSGHHLII
jgi:hypothetical protein